MSVKTHNVLQSNIPFLTELRKAALAMPGHLPLASELPHYAMSLEAAPTLKTSLEIDAIYEVCAQEQV